MRARRSFNPKRRMRSSEDLALQREAFAHLASNVHYGGNPEHKRNPGDFGLTPLSSLRPGKTLCDQVDIFSRAEALKLLRAGLKRGLVSVQERDGWPQNVWAVSDTGQPLEGQLEAPSVYHGYPLAENDPFREEVLTRWNRP